MEEIAEMAGVSTATVSRVMHGSPLVSNKTAERVRSVMEKMHYFPNVTATTLKHGASHIYGLIIPDITNPFFPEFIKAFESIAVRENQEVLIANTDFHPDGMQLSIRRLLTRQAEGVALLVSVLPDIATSFHKNGVPIVTFDRRIVGNGISDVGIDSRSAMHKSVQHLKELGHSKIGYIGGIAAEPTSDHRFNSFVKALKKHDLVCHSEFLKIGNYRIGGGTAAMTEILSQKYRPTAIIAVNDLTAIGAMRVITAHGYSIGADFSIIGFDDIQFSELVTPALTTMALSRVELAKNFFNALQSFERSIEKNGKQYLVKARLVVRQSTGRPRKSRQK
jgi:LacI family transcriptional regulator